jgi:cytochrome c biogenesis protein CcdA
MSVIDVLFGFLAGLVSCLTPDALLLLPLALGAAGAIGRRSVIAPAVGLGLSLVLTGIAAGSFGMFGLDAQSFRRILCAILLVLGLTLMSTPLVERFPRLTGGSGSLFDSPDSGSLGPAMRQVLLALFVGANWLPLPGPTLGKASLLAADTRGSGLGYGILFAFGIGAAIPWILVGRIVRLLLRPVAAPVFDGMAGQRFLGLALLVVAILGGSGQFDMVAQWLEALLPVWTQKLAMTF